MSEGFGIESPGKHHSANRQKPARWLVLIDAGGGGQLARLFNESREQIAEFDASTEETSSLIGGLTPQRGAALGTEWDKALGGHSRADRAAAEVYELSV
ncbi:hypothetical protein SNE35_10025 [Paucibacter sp. R3-3]|uniref:Uncharacterized protein n=1 Tax=Roseateles agri TaxID=3098619 RepID=A0ABU5DEZ7_9BURK|nr:hypothetical protein [Paucibacter sp. R3-3]MDY0744845.1 hypothetical protein [Paucibacter sp. R3-3]